MITLVFIRTWLLIAAATAGALFIEHAAFGWFGWFLLAAPATVAAFVGLSAAMLGDWRAGRTNGDYRYLIVRDR